MPLERSWMQGGRPLRYLFAGRTRARYCLWQDGRHYSSDEVWRRPGWLPSVPARCLCTSRIFGDFQKINAARGRPVGCARLVRSLTIGSLSLTVSNIRIFFIRGTLTVQYHTNLLRLAVCTLTNSGRAASRSTRLELSVSGSLSSARHWAMRSHVLQGRTILWKGFHRLTSSVAVYA